MIRASLFGIVALSLLGCVGTRPSQSLEECLKLPMVDSSGTYAGCVYYPGYGWARRPYPRGSAPGVFG